MEFNLKTLLYRIFYALRRFIVEFVFILYFYISHNFEKFFVL